MRVNALTDVDGERAKIVQYFVEAEGTVAAGREMLLLTSERKKSTIAQ